MSWNPMGFSDAAFRDNSNCNVIDRWAFVLMQFTLITCCVALVVSICMWINNSSKNGDPHSGSPSMNHRSSSSCELAYLNRQQDKPMAKSGGVVRSLRSWRCSYTDNPVISEIFNLWFSSSWKTTTLSMHTAAPFLLSILIVNLYNSDLYKEWGQHMGWG